MKCAACTKPTSQLVPHNGKAFCFSCTESRKLHHFLQQIPCTHPEWTTIRTILEGTRAVLSDLFADHKRKVEDEHIDNFLATVPVTILEVCQHQSQDTRTEHHGASIPSDKAWLPPWSTTAGTTPPPRPPRQHPVSVLKRAGTPDTSTVPATKKAKDRTSQTYQCPPAPANQIKTV